jgi:hypothetical protein
MPSIYTFLVQFVLAHVECGAEFIHGDRAITRQHAGEAGISLAPVDRYGNLWWHVLHSFIDGITYILVLR